MASKRLQRRKSCEGKKRHPSQTEAVADLISIKKHQGPSKIRSYKCKFCGWWHIGHFA